MIFSPTPATGPAARTLLILGSFGRQQVERAITDWSSVHVLEIDCYLPEHLRKQCAGVMTLPPLLQEDEAETLQKRTDDLLDRFLEDRVSMFGVPTGRRFRAACMSIEAWRMVGPHLVCLEYARRLVGLGPWESIIVAPGAGVSIRAFQQLALALGVPVQVLAVDRQKPPFWWLLKRRLQRFLTRRRVQKASSPTPRLQPASRPGEHWCADPRLEAMMSKSESADRWVRGPGFTEPDPQELQDQRALYLKWWSAWWNDWLLAHGQDDPLADGWILEDLGRWFCEDRYPRHALLLRQARAAIRKGRPTRVLVGSMRGRAELLWGIAAQDHAIPVGVYTIDCHIDSRLCFKPDLVFVDDMLQWRTATRKGGLDATRIICVQSHRQLPPPEAPRPPATHPRRRLYLADTYYSGIVTGSSPLLSLWGIRCAVEAARLMPEHDFIIKFHPVRERPEAAFHLSGLHHQHLYLKEAFTRQLQPPPNVTFLGPEVRLSDELPKVDLLLNIQSYAVLEAFVLQLPVIYLQPWDEEGLYPSMNAMGVMQIASDAERLVELIRLNLHDPDHARQQVAAQSQYLDFFYWKDAPHLADAALEKIVPNRIKVVPSPPPSRIRETVPAEGERRVAA